MEVRAANIVSITCLGNVVCHPWIIVYDTYTKNYPLLNYDMRILCIRYSCFDFVYQVRAAESLTKLSSDVKEYLILNDFPYINSMINTNTRNYKATQQDCDMKLQQLRDDMASDLYELEDEYYSSPYK